MNDERADNTNPPEQSDTPEAHTSTVEAETSTPPDAVGESPAATQEEVFELPERDPKDVHTYHRLKRMVHLGGLAFSIIYWSIWTVYADDYVAFLAGGISSAWLGLAAGVVTMLGLATVLTLPLDYYSSYIVEKRYDLTNQTPKSWLIFEIKGWIVGLIIGGIVLSGLYAALWYGGSLWGVWVWIGVMALSVGLAKLFPLVILPIFYPAKPLERPSLTERLTQMAGEAGMTITGIFDLELSKETKKANAMLAGLGSSRRVYLADTLLKAFDDDEISVVFAHELGHHMRGHITKGIGMSAVISSLLVALIWWVLNPYAGQPGSWQPAVAGFAPVMLIMSIFPLLTGLVTNAVMRRFEYQCDSDALRLTDDPQAFRNAFHKLTALNMVDTHPPLWEEIIFDDHPAMSKRIAAADAYEQSKGAA